MMTTPFHLPNGSPAHYGFGLVIDTYFDHGSFNDHPRFWHLGGSFGFSAGNFVFPNDDLDFLILTNQASKAYPGIMDIAATVFEAIFSAPPSIDPDLPAAGQNPEVTKRSTELLNGLLDGTIDRSQLSSDLLAKLTPEQLQSFTAKLKPLGKASKVVFRKHLKGEKDNIYFYRVDFEKEPSNFVMQINKESNLVDSFYPPISVRN
jgi:D-alanyl-D-alanine carboxypeptidase